MFTPSHDTRFLTECYESLAAQTYSDWEWVVLLNGEAADWLPPREDARVRMLRAPKGLRGVGAVKRAVCEAAVGDVLVELDHDDILTPECLAEVVAAFSDDGMVLAFSDFAQVEPDRSPNYDRFRADHGWVYTSETLADGVTYQRCHAALATPHNVGYIWYAPNHVRAFRRSAYESVGAYDASLEILDDQDLMSRLYMVGEFKHIDKCLYLQRVGVGNTQSDPAINAAIQLQTVEYYRRYIEDLALAWARRRSLACLRLRTPMWVGDASDDRYEDVVIDPSCPVLPGPDDGVGVVRAYEVLQRVPDRVGLFNEVYRVLAHAGLLLTETPSSDGRGAFQDPSHVVFYNENSFWYYTEGRLQDVSPGLKARFQTSHLRTYFPTPWHEEVKICYVQANLLALKEGDRQGGMLFW